MNKDTLRQLANALSVVIALTVNILASALPLNGQNTGEISDRFQVYFVPAGYVFAIWGIIYIGWIAFSIYQFRANQKESPRLRKLGYLFALSGIFNAAWLFCSASRRRSSLVLSLASTSSCDHTRRISSPISRGPH